MFFNIISIMNFLWISGFVFSQSYLRKYAHLPFHERAKIIYKLTEMSTKVG